MNLEHENHVDLLPSSLDVSYYLSPSSSIKSCDASNQVDNNNKKMNIKKKKYKQKIKSQPTTPHSAENVYFPTKPPRKPKFP